MQIKTLSHPSTVDARSFRMAVGAFATGVAVITTTYPQGRPHGLTCNSFSSLSLDPPLILWSVRQEARAAAIYAAADTFAVNILAADQQAISAQFASAEDDRFAGLAHEAGINGDPLIRGCIAWIECRMYERRAGGDHTILIGEVVRVSTFDRAPLIFWRGKYIDEDIAKSGSKFGVPAPEIMFWA